MLTWLLLRVGQARCEVDVEEGTANGVKSELEIIPSGGERNECRCEDGNDDARSRLC